MKPTVVALAGSLLIRVLLAMAPALTCVHAMLCLNLRHMLHVCLLCVCLAAAVGTQDSIRAFTRSRGVMENWLRGIVRHGRLIWQICLTLRPFMNAILMAVTACLRLVAPTSTFQGAFWLWLRLIAVAAVLRSVATTVASVRALGLVWGQ